MLSYSGVLDYLYSQLPMFHRIGAAAYKADLNNTLALCATLGNPERKFKSIHIAGTNGKGSVSHMLAAILQQAGYNTGLYTSPHLKDFRERVRINGAMILEERVTDFVNRHIHEFEKLQLSFFEWTVGLAFDYFSNEKVDIAVIETGLGGRLDSTNVITPELSVITNISLDHTNLLGDTIEKIAGEKAGIIKPGVPVVIGEKDVQSAGVFNARAGEMNSAINFASDIYKAMLVKREESSQQIRVESDGRFVGDYALDLPGDYQLRNICTVLQAVDVLRLGGWSIEDTHIRSALADVRKLTGLRGRWEILGHRPLIVCDVAHNVAGITGVIDQLKLLKAPGLHMVFGVVNDKDVPGVLELLPHEAHYYWCRANLPRALDATELGSLGAKFGLKGNVYESVPVAYEAAKAAADAEDVIFIGGSTFVVAEVI